MLYITSWVLIPCGGSSPTRSSRVNFTTVQLVNLPSCVFFSSPRACLYEYKLFLLDKRLTTWVMALKSWTGNCNLWWNFKADHFDHGAHDGLAHPGWEMATRVARYLRTISLPAKSAYPFSVRGNVAFKGGERDLSPSSAGGISYCFPSTLAVVEEDTQLQLLSGDSTLGEHTVYIKWKGYAVQTARGKTAWLSLL